MRREEIRLWGDGTVVRDFVCVTDVARLCATVLRSDSTGIFNVGSGIGTSINQLLELISQHVGVTPVVHREAPRQFDVPSIILDCELARTTFDWVPATKISEGLEDVALWLRNGKTSLQKLAI